MQRQRLRCFYVGTRTLCHIGSTVLWASGSQFDCSLKISQRAFKNFRSLEPTADEIEVIHLRWESLGIWVSLSDSDVQQGEEMQTWGISWYSVCHESHDHCCTSRWPHTAVYSPVSQIRGDSTGCLSKIAKAKRGFRTWKMLEEKCIC